MGPFAFVVQLVILCAPAPAPAAPVDCGVRPRMVCCKAEIPQCWECRDRALEELEAWRARCEPQLTIDCTRPPMIACCNAQNETCKRCQRGSSEKMREWAKVCRPDQR